MKQHWKTNKGKFKGEVGVWEPENQRRKSPQERNTFSTDIVPEKAILVSLNKQNSGRGSQLKTTPIFQIATEVIFQNPIQNIAICPNNLEDAPKICMDWLRDAPTTWTETRFLDGYPGKYVILARKSTDGRWFVAGLNATGEVIKSKIDLSFLGDGEVQFYTDDKKTKEPSLSTLKLKTKKPYQFEIQPSGATMIMR